MEREKRRDKIASSASRVSRNTLINFAAKVAELSAGLITIPLATRYLGLELFGEYAFLGAVSMVLGPTIAMGSLRILIRDMSVEREKSPLFLSSGLHLNWLMSIAVSLIAVIVIFYFNLTSKNAVLCLYIALLGQVLKSMKNTIDSVFIAYEKMIYIFITTIINKVLYVTFLVLAIYYDTGIIGLFLSIAISNGAAFIFTLAVSSIKFAKPQWGINFRQVKYLFMESLPVAVAVLIMQGYTYTNVFLLKIYQSNAHVSLFQAPQRVINPLFLLPTSFLMAFVPSLSRLGSDSDTDQDSRQGLLYAYTTTMKYMLIVTLPIAVYTTVSSGWIVNLLFGKEFSESARSFQLIMWTIIPLFANALLTFLLTSIRRQKVLTISSSICFITNCILAYILVPKYGHVGASIAYLIAYYVLFLVNFYYTTKYLELIPVRRISIRPLFAGGIMLLMLLLLVNKLNMFVLSVTAFLLYFGLLFALKAFTPEEIRIFKKAFSRESKGRQRRGPGPEMPDSSIE